MKSVKCCSYSSSSVLFWALSTTIIIGSVLLQNHSVNAAGSGGGGQTECQNSDSPIFCHGSRVVRSVIHRVLYNDNSGGGGSSPLKLFPGLEIVQVTDGLQMDDASTDARSNSVDDSSSSSSSSSNGGVGIVGRASKFLEGHEIKIKFADLMQRADIKDVVASAFTDLDDSKEVFEGRKKDKGGLGGVLLMGLMMKKMMAVIGMGAIGAIAAKALGVALMALMLAALAGLKKLTEHDDDGGGHKVQYVMAHGYDHHRKRRDLDENADTPLPYRGWPTVSRS